MNQQLIYLKITKYTILIFLFVFFSCKQKEASFKESVLIKEFKISSIKKDVPSNQIREMEEKDTISDLIKPSKISDEKFNTFIKKSDFKKQIRSYYNKKYEEVIKNFLKEDDNNWIRSKNYIKKTPSDSILQLAYMVTENQSYDISIASLWIPLKPNNNTNFVFGDLNNDQKEDCLVTVHSEGGWSASNASNNDIFIFLNEGINYRLAYVFTSSGNYNPALIDNNQIIANELSYAPKDARCCPSLHRTDTTNLAALKGYLKIIN